MSTRGGFLRLGAALLFAACIPIPERTPPPPEQPVPAHAPSTHPATTLPSHPELAVQVSAPESARYHASSLGPAALFVTLAVTNVGTRPARVDGLRVAFQARREGVVFPCRPHIGGSTRVREPSELAPGGSFVYERDLDCSMPLVGRYDVRTFVRFAPGAPPEQEAEGDLAGAFTVEVRDGARAPRAYPGREGVYAFMTGSSVTQPLSPEAWVRGDYHVVVALINGSPRVVPLGPARLAFLVFRRGSPLPCSGESERLALPESLGPGATHTAYAAVTCAPSEEGDYELVGKLALGEGSPEPVEIGRVNLRVSRDPLELPSYTSSSADPFPRAPGSTPAP